MAFHDLPTLTKGTGCVAVICDGYVKLKLKKGHDLGKVLFGATLKYSAARPAWPLRLGASERMEIVAACVLLADEPREMLTGATSQKTLPQMRLPGPKIEPLPSRP